MTTSAAPSDAVARLRAIGQSVWIDDLTRDMIAAGEVSRLRAAGVTGFTDNPTTFHKAVTGSDLYDEDIQRLSEDHGATDILWALMIDDVRRAADILHSVYRDSGSADGVVSIEVSPDVAYATQRTVEMARELWRRCGRANVLIKIPATSPGLPAMRQLVSEGINVNATLTFSVRRYREVVEAFVSGLEDRRKGRQPLDHVASVASFFVSRVDAKVDSAIKCRLEDTAVPVEERRALASLLGKIAIANSKLAFHWFRKLHVGPRWQALEADGARPQRCLWASTSVKDRTYPPTMYVEALAGPDTIDTMARQTFDALPDARIDGSALEEGGEVAEEQIERLAGLGIDLERISAGLETEGVKAFSDSYHRLLNAIEGKIS
jgi:transaldolase